MGKPLPLILCLILMVAIIVCADVFFFKSAIYFWPRLILNVGIVLVFISVCMRFFL